MESGLLYRYGKPVAGHEREAIALFAEVLEFWMEKRERGEITFFEPFIVETSDFDEDAGFWVIKGPEEKIAAFRHEDRYQKILMKASIFLAHLTVATLRVGDAVNEQVDLLGKVYAEVGV